MAISKALETKILRYHFVELWGPHTIAAQLGIHHSVVDRVLSQAGMPKAERMRQTSIIDPYIPFIIETVNATVTVLGTSFNVRAVPDDSAPETVVSVATGIVEVAAKNAPDNTIRLEAGQATRVARATTLSSLPSVATDWRRFVFLNQPLGVMFDEIERRFGIEIIASEPIRVHLHNIGTTAKRAEQLVIEICQSSKMKLRYRATANGFEVFEAEP